MDEWRLELARAARGVAGLEQALGAGACPDAAGHVEHRYPVSVTPHLLDLIRSHPQGAAVARQFLPDVAELDDALKADPLAEEACSPVPGLIRRYPDRAVILAVNACAAYCRHCTRKRRAGLRGPTWFGHRRAILAYLRAHPEIADVLVSGGDPLILPTPALDRLLAELETLPQLQVIRVASRVPASLPSRLDDDALIRVLARSGRLWLNTQFNHPAELTQASRRACARLVEAGIPVGNQSVLLKGVNDDPQVMERLVRGLVAMRVRPYYLFLCEPVRGVGHLRTSVARGLAILEHLRGRVSGLAIPTLAVDLPGGAGKVALTPQAVERREGDTLWFRSWRGDLVPYPDPPEP